MGISSASREDYVRSIYLLKEHGEGASVTMIATYLGVSKPGVTQMVRKLTAAGFVTSARYGSIGLTRKGLTLGERLTRRHRIIELFLARTLRLPRSRVHAEANRLEHTFSDEILTRIERLLGYPAQDPHGKRIPRVMPHRATRPLARTRQGRPRTQRGS
jgi:DtxR family transcriptional regulator, Mn-dependent transcriptional regulator